ncbi:hypothetical protein ABEG72_20325 [Pantoea agglomerans]|uniref:hypothetical protein n=1 Tax=Enterobacter agglomerans TaxID=549 RepID=UPI0032095008
MIPIKLRLALLFITVVTGVYIPASVMGLTFHNALYAKQKLNCIDDTSSALMKMFDEYDSAGLAKKNDKIDHDFKTCVHNLDYNKGLITFVREELSR